MALKNKSMYAILGILNQAPGTGYDIKKYCDQVLSGFWNENFGHIYPTLKMLLDEGMIETIAGENDEKKIRYQITSVGKQELQKWFSEEIKPQPVRSEFMLKLLFSSDQPKENIIHMLEDYKELHEKNIQHYKEMEKMLTQGTTDISEDRTMFYDMILRRGILSDEAVVTWCEETIKRMN